MSDAAWKSLMTSLASASLLKTNVSCWPWPVRVSWPSPTWMVTLPPPPKIVSLPSLAVIQLLSPLPCAVWA